MLPPVAAYYTGQPRVLPQRLSLLDHHNLEYITLVAMYGHCGASLREYSGLLEVTINTVKLREAHQLMF